MQQAASDDLRTLRHAASQSMDAVIACDNSLPHLLSDDELLQALRSCHRCLRPGGVAVFSVRGLRGHRARQPRRSALRVAPRSGWAVSCGPSLGVGTGRRQGSYWWGAGRATRLRRRETSVGGDAAWAALWRHFEGSAGRAAADADRADVRTAPRRQPGHEDDDRPHPSLAMTTSSGMAATVPAVGNWAQVHATESAAAPSALTA